MSIKTIARTLFGTALIAVSTSAATAQSVVGHIGCLTVWNRTGQTANDFHLELYGPQVNFLMNGFYSIPYSGSKTVVSNPNGVHIDFTGSTTNPGSSAFFSVSFSSAPPDYITGSRAYWTLNGNQIGDRVPIPDVPWWEPKPTGGGGSGNDPFIQGPKLGGYLTDVNFRRYVVATPSDFDVDDMKPDSSFWQAATLVDQNPVLLPAGDFMSYGFTWDFQPSINYAVKYEITAQGGAPLMTLTSAATILAVPEPSSCFLLVSALAVPYIRVRKITFERP